jgi:hypothetical protein
VTPPLAIVTVPAEPVKTAVSPDAQATSFPGVAFPFHQSAVVPLSQVPELPPKVAPSVMFGSQPRTVALYVWAIAEPGRSIPANKNAAGIILAMKRQRRHGGKLKLPTAIRAVCGDPARLEFKQCLRAIRALERSG